MTTAKPLANLSGLEFRVAARNEIQSFLLKLFREMQKTSSRVSVEHMNLQLALGAAFSLWRAVFLMPLPDVEHDPETKGLNAQRFLETVVETNAISFTDDRKHREWIAGYYLNNARYRLAELGGASVERVRMTPQALWCEYFYSLTEGLDQGFPNSCLRASGPVDSGSGVA